MPSLWQEGAKVGFEARVCPTRRVKLSYAHGGDNSESKTQKKGYYRHGERDAYVAEFRRNGASKNGARRSREAVYIDWFTERVEREGAVKMLSASLASFQKKPAARNLGKPVEFVAPDAVMRGEFTIEDSQAFSKLVKRGVGRSRSYGYGMLMLRPAKNPE